MWQDAVNASLEIVGGAMVCASIRRLVRDKRVRGIHPSHVAYSVASGIWFVYYYAHLDQLLSFWCALAYAAAVSTWAVLMVAYCARELACGTEL